MDTIAFLERLSRTGFDDLSESDLLSVLARSADSRAPIDATIDAVAAAAVTERRDLLELAVVTARRVQQTHGQIALTETERAAMEAFVLLFARPSLVVRDHVAVGISLPWPNLDAPGVSAAARGVGRLDRVRPSGGRLHQGSGLLVAPRLVLTNNHVVVALSGHDPHQEPWSDATRFGAMVDQLNDLCDDEPARRPVFDLRCESGMAVEQSARVTRVHRHHSTLDAALLELDAPPAAMRVQHLRARSAGELADHRFYALGYPAFSAPDPTRAFVLRVLFRGDLDTLTANAEPGSSVKRIAPGRFGTSSAGSGATTHDASTLPGSSGSALLDMDDNVVVGLHFAGDWFTTNQAVTIGALVDDGFFDGIDVTLG